MKNELFKSVLVVAVAVLVSFVVVPRSTQTIKEVQNVGAIASYDFASPYFSYGGVQNWGARMTMYQASTTQCAIQSPAATSTLLNATVKFDVSSTTAMTVALYKSATAFAQTTQIGNSIALSANGQGFILASTTDAQAIAQTQVFAPNSWLVVYSTGGTGTYSPTGSCQAEWIAHP